MKTKSPARIEQSIIFEAGKSGTIEFYNISIEDGYVAMEIPFECLLSLRDLINEIEESKKGGEK